jgi:hypothetical protein
LTSLILKKLKLKKVLKKFRFASENEKKVNKKEKLNIAALNNSELKNLAITSKSQKQIFEISRHLFKLKNHKSASQVASSLQYEKLSIDQKIIIGRIFTSSDCGVLADQALCRILKNEDLDNHASTILLKLVDWILCSGLHLDEKLGQLQRLQSTIKVRKDDFLNEHLQKIRFAEFRLKFSNDIDLNILDYAEIDKLSIGYPNYQIKFIAPLKALGFEFEAAELLSLLISHHRFSNPEVFISKLNFDPDWIKNEGITLQQIPANFLERTDFLDSFSGKASISQEYKKIFSKCVESQMKKFRSANVYEKDKILRALMKADCLDEALIIAHNEKNLPDTLLSYQSAKALKYFIDQDHYSAQQQFWLVLEEDPEDSIAAQGLRLALPRTGHNIDSMIDIRRKIGYGGAGNGRVGVRSDIGSEVIISLLMNGSYTSGLYAKRHAQHWRLLKNLYGNKCLNFELIPENNTRNQTLFLIADDGVGDEVRTAQFYNHISSQFKEVTATCDPRLIEIFQRSFPNINFIPVIRYRKGLIGREKELKGRILGLNQKLTHFLSEECRQHMEAADFLTFGQTLFFNRFAGRIPRPLNGGYLIPKEGSKIRSNGPRKLKVGLLWRSHLRTMWRKFMYLDIKDFSPILDLEGVQYYSIQHCIDEDEINYCKEKSIELIDDIDLFNDLDGLSSFVSQLDLIIGISSVPIELGAALGVPVWMLGFSPENYYLRTNGGKTSQDNLSMNSTVIAPPWIDFSAPRDECLKLVFDETRVRLTEMVQKRKAEL